MNELDYCISKFKKNFFMYKGKRIALYGNAEIAVQIVSKYPDFSCVCVADDKRAGKYIGQYYIITFAQMRNLEVECLIIVEDIRTSLEIYQKISAQYVLGQMCILNLYGKEMKEYYKELMLREIGYVNLTEKDLKKAIDAHEVISFDIGNTLFTAKHIYYSDFYLKIGKELQELGINIYDFAEQVDSIRRRDYYSNLRSIIEKLVEELNMTTKELEIIWSVIVDEVRKSFIPRKTILDLLKYAISENKKICIIDDMPDYRIPVITWNMLLRNYGIKENIFFVSSLEYFQRKEDGLFRNIIEKFGEDTCYLHIGDEIDKDFLMPFLYRMDFFWVKSARELFDNVDSLILEQLESKRVRILFGEYLICRYNDEYLIDEVRQSSSKSDELAIELEKEIHLCKEYHSLVASEPMTFTPILFECSEKVNILDYSPLVFPVFDIPKVSIIIPVYNQFNYTYNCLKSILEHTKDVKYEIIVADDCSCDQTLEIEKIVQGINIIRNKKNLKFLKNCNMASEYAKGKYILFLNNDTQVQPGWLQAMTTLFEQNKNVGMVGAKLVYPDGHLQEAGGIVWKDGSARNYGNGENPDSYEYCYVKEVDYISGATIMIKTSLWKEIGGFDDIYSPGYYEDTDLAFEIRKRGYKVCLQPKSIVVHFEGISNGTNLSSGLKHYQIINQEKFYKKWQDILNEEQCQKDFDIYYAKDRGQVKKQILVVDHYVPNYSKDAGGRCTFMYIKAFLKMGMKVTFIGDKYEKSEPYTTILTQMGVEVLYGEFCRYNWKEWLEENLKYFDYIYLQRPDVSSKYMDIVKMYGQGKVFYFAHDLYHIRFYRDYKVTGNKESLEISKKWKEIELELFKKADVGHVVGTFEQKMIQEIYPEKPIRNIPIYIYDQFPVEIEKDFSKREDIIFVGGFNHRPNLDAVLWFAEKIYPRILIKYPRMVWHIIGSNAPKEVQELASPNIVLEGFISDEELEKFYKKCRLAVVPLRYGAGVKGKIVEAAYYQIPMVTTSIGGEGLDSTCGTFIMEDDADKMAELINSLYVDYNKLEEMSDAGREFIEKYFTLEIAEKVLKKDMDL